MRSVRACLPLAIALAVGACGRLLGTDDEPPLAPIAESDASLSADGGTPPSPPEEDAARHEAGPCGFRDDFESEIPAAWGNDAGRDVARATFPVHDGAFSLVAPEGTRRTTTDACDSLSLWVSFENPAPGDLVRIAHTAGSPLEVRLDANLKPVLSTGGGAAQTFEETAGAGRWFRVRVNAGAVYLESDDDDSDLYLKLSVQFGVPTFIELTPTLGRAFVDEVLSPDPVGDKP